MVIQFFLNTTTPDLYMFINQTTSIMDTAMYKNIDFGKLPGNVNPGIYIKVNRKGVLINSARNIFNDRLSFVLSI